jgi:hypothetical protein
MYESHKLCDTLTPKEICLVVEQYERGVFLRRYHEHVPKQRLSESALQHLLQALVLKFENNEARTIVRAHLNSRGNQPPRHRLMWHVSYPEPGVLRKCCGTDTHAWADQVVTTETFRRKS